MTRPVAGLGGRHPLGVGEAGEQHDEVVPLGGDRRPGVAHGEVGQLHRPSVVARRQRGRRGFRGRPDPPVGDDGRMSVKRPCAKVLLVDEDDRVLLFSGIDRTKPDVPPWWFPVGGALEPGETFAEAAVRETLEETGLRIDDPGPVVFTRSLRWDFEGTDYDQEERYFLVRVRSFTPTPTAWTDVETATMRGHRWWSVDELRATDEQVFPEDLADRLTQLLSVRARRSSRAP